MLYKTLVVHHRSGIGDLVWHIPYIRAIANTSKNGKVTVLARPSCRAADILAGEACVEEVIEYDRRPRDKSRKGKHDSLPSQFRLSMELRKKKFDRIFIFSGHPMYGVMALLAGIPIRAGFGFSLTQRLFLNQPPYIDRFKGKGSWVYPEATAFAIAHGLVKEPAVPKMTVPDELVAELDRTMRSTPRPRYALAIGASEPDKNWGNDKFVQLAKFLADSGFGVLVLGGPMERDKAEAAFSPSSLGANARNVRIMCQSSVLKSAAALKACDFCIGNDTGILNVAAACNIPAIGLFGATQPLTHDSLIYAISSNSMETINVNDVVDQVIKLKAPGFEAYHKNTNSITSELLQLPSCV